MARLRRMRLDVTFGAIVVHLIHGARSRSEDLFRILRHYLFTTLCFGLTHSPFCTVIVLTFVEVKEEMPIAIVPAMFGLAIGRNGWKSTDAESAARRHYWGRR